MNNIEKLDKMDKIWQINIKKKSGKIFTEISSYNEAQISY